ncbi:MAG: PIN domain-containing protein [Acidimicrobiia bacterium]
MYCFAERAWELRANATIYDAAHLALAELLDAPLLALDERFASVSGIRCEVRVPWRSGDHREQRPLAGDAPLARAA